MTTVNIRLAMRHEGTWWVAYLAAQNTMKGATELGRFRMTLAQNGELKASFMELMQRALVIAAKEVTGVEMVWPHPPEPAPESERGGHA